MASTRLETCDHRTKNRYRRRTSEGGRTRVGKPIDRSGAVFFNLGFPHSLFHLASSRASLPSGSGSRRITMRLSPCKKEATDIQTIRTRRPRGGFHAGWLCRCRAFSPHGAADSKRRKTKREYVEEKAGVPQPIRQADYSSFAREDAPLFHSLYCL